MTLTTSMS